MRKLFRNQNKQITQNLVEKHNSSSHRALSDMKCKVLVAKWKMTAQQKHSPCLPQQYLFTSREYIIPYNS